MLASFLESPFREHDYGIGSGGRQMGREERARNGGVDGDVWWLEMVRGED